MAVQHGTGGGVRSRSRWPRERRHAAEENAVLHCPKQHALQIVCRSVSVSHVAQAREKAAGAAH